MEIAVAGEEKIVLLDRRIRSEPVTGSTGKTASHSPRDEQFAAVFDAIKRLIAQDDVRKAQPKRRIGFTS